MRGAFFSRVIDVSSSFNKGTTYILDRKVVSSSVFRLRNTVESESIYVHSLNLMT